MRPVSLVAGASEFVNDSHREFRAVLGSLIQTRAEHVAFHAERKVLEVRVDVDTRAQLITQAILRKSRDLRQKI